MLSNRLKLIGNEDVKLFTNPNTGEEEMYVSENLIPQKVLSMALRVIGNRGDYIYCKAGSWNYFFRDNRDELRRFLEE